MFPKEQMTTAYFMPPVQPFLIIFTYLLILLPTSTSSQHQKEWIRWMEFEWKHSIEFVLPVCVCVCVCVCRYLIERFWLGWSDSSLAAQFAQCIDVNHMGRPSARTKHLRNSYRKRRINSIQSAEWPCPVSGEKIIATKKNRPVWMSRCVQRRSTLYQMMW